MFPAEGIAWTASDVLRWMSAVGEHLGTTGEDLRRDAVAKGSVILEAKRKRRAAELQLSSRALFVDASEVQLILKVDQACDRTIARTLNQLEVLQTARRGDLPPPQRIEVSVDT